MPKYLVETVSVFRMRYVVEAKTASDARDEVTMCVGDDFQDLILGGSFADMSYDRMLISPTIIWGDGSGKFDYNNKANAFDLGQKPYINNIKTGNNDDLVFYDIDQDGLNEIIALFIIQIDDDPNNNGLTTMYSFLQIYSPDSNFNFSNKTSEWFK